MGLPDLQMERFRDVHDMVVKERKKVGSGRFGADNSIAFSKSSPQHSAKLPALDAKYEAQYVYEDTRNSDSNFE